MMFKTVHKIESQDNVSFLNAISQKKPIQIKGLIEKWPALSWDFEALKARYGDRRVKVLVDLPKYTGILKKGQEAYEKEMFFSDFVQKIFEKDELPCYLAYSKLTDLLEEEKKSFNFEEIVPLDEYSTSTRLWIGSENTCSGLHTDLKDNIFAQIVGNKRVFLISQDETHLVYPFIDNIVNSQVDPEQFDEKKFPKFSEATVYETIVEPGDLLFIPRGWWHYLRSESPSISINHWFGKPVSPFTYLALLIKLGPSYLYRTWIDFFRYGFLKKTYQKAFFFTPVSTGERFYNWIRYGNFSKENDPAEEKSKTTSFGAKDAEK